MRARNVYHVATAPEATVSRLRTLILVIAACAIFAAAALWILTLPSVVPATALPAHTPNLANGATMFTIGGCSSCHAVPNNDPEKVDRKRLGGGLALKSPFGVFYAPNISPDPKDGIGSWSEANFVTALWKGTSEHGANLYPAFPYTSYRYMQLGDVRDLFAYIKTLPAVQGRSRRHELSFPFNERRLLGIWKLLFLGEGAFVSDPSKPAQLNRGAYLVNGPGHCAECHSPRDLLGGIIESQRFAGGSPDGTEWAPNITPTGLRGGDEDWSEKDIASFLDDGMTPSGDFAGGAMAEVIRNTSLLASEDRDAIAAYVAALPPRQGPTPPPKKD
jgi:mono/diheme cytochrome c family protein